MKRLKKFLSVTLPAAIICSSVITAAPTAAYAEDEAAFSARLNEIMPRDKNYMFSPYSLKLALAMTANGTQGETRRELLELTDIDDLDKFNEETKAMITQYSEETDRYRRESAFTLDIANSIWLNTDPEYNISGSNFSPGFAEKAAEYYFAEADTVTSGSALEKINGWCNKKTKGRIPEIIDTPEFIACLVNAIYFKARWYNEFPKHKTKEDVFTDRNGGKAVLDFMHMTEQLPYYEDEDMQIVALPYQDTSLTMYLVLNNDKRADITPYFDKLDWSSYKIKLSVPKFTVEYDDDMKNSFSQLGVEKAFEASYDFDPMFDKHWERYIDKVLHKTFITIDEEGTEAAAATAVVIGESTGGGGPRYKTRVFNADRPFSFIIADRNSKEIFFMGEYAFPDRENYKPITLPSMGYKQGDADNDNMLTAADAAWVLQKALVSTYKTPVETVDKENYRVVEDNVTYDRFAVIDMNKNGVADADDSARIMQDVLGAGE